MRYLNFGRLAAAAAVMALCCTQPAMAGSTLISPALMMADAPVITAGSESARQSTAQPPMSGGSSAPGNASGSVTPGTAPVENGQTAAQTTQTAPQTTQTAPQTTVQNQTDSQSQTNSQSQGLPGMPAQPEPQSKAPAGDEGTVLSPVVTAGGTQTAGQTVPGQTTTDQTVPGQTTTDQTVPGQTTADQTAAGQTVPDQTTAGSTVTDQTNGQLPVLTPIDPLTGQPVAADQTAAAGQQESQQGTDQQGSGRTIDPSKPMVALTFDDGPQASVGNRIMDCLAQYGGKATFFMVGDRVAANKTEVQRMVAEGHEVANHTMNHKYLQKLGAAEIQAQVNQCNDAIEAACGVRPKIMRLPGGNHNATVDANTHMPMIQWSIDTLDWKTRNADKTVAAVLDHVKDGDIILMHELYSQTGDAALRIIPELHNRGYQMVTVSEMAAAKGKTLEAGKLYSAFH